MSDVAESAAFDPHPADARYPAPRARLDPDRQRNWFLRLLPVALAHPVLLASALVAALASMMTSVISPALLGMAINDAFGQHGDAPSALMRRILPFLGRGGDTASILQTYLLALLAVGAVRALCSGYYRYALYRGAYYIENDLRVILYEHLTCLPFTFFDRVQSGQIISRANSDIRAVQMLLTFAPMVIISWLSFGLALTFMLSVHVGLTFAAVFALPGIFVLGARMRREMFPLSWMTQARLAELSTVVDESIQGVRVVKAFAAEQRQLSLLAKTAARVRWASSELVDLRARFAPLMENVARLGPAFVLLYGGYLVLHGRIAGVGTLVTFNTYMIMLQAPFRVLGFLLSMSQRAEASAQRIFEVLDEPVQIADKPTARALPAAEGGRRIQLADVSFGYASDRPVLVGLNLDVRPGETVALVGRTGSGKSTLARLLPRFYEVDQGAVLIDGHDVRDLTLASLRANIGLAIDEPFLFSLSIRDNIAYGRPSASLDAVIAAAQAAQADEFIDALPQGYDTKVGERGYTLSGGQRQRIALARLFLLNPPVLVLDDATSAVDVQVEERILSALQDRMRDRTTLLISHREPTLRLADRVLLLIGGQIVASGTHAQLMAAEPRYREALARSEQALAAERARAVERMRVAAARATATSAANGFPDGGTFGGFSP
jgi:ATP-binding cassette subfamily B protein